MPNEASDVILTPARMYHSAVGTTLPAVTLAVDGTWPVGWTEVGLTKEPLTLNVTWETLLARVQQSNGPVAGFPVSEEITLSTVLAELTVPTLGLAFNHDTTIGSSSAPVTYDTADFGDKRALPIKQWGAEGWYYDEDGNLLPIRFFLYRGIVVEGGDVVFGKADYVGVPLKIKALWDLTKSRGQRAYKIQKITETA